MTILVDYLLTIESGSWTIRLITGQDSSNRFDGLRKQKRLNWRLQSHWGFFQDASKNFWTKLIKRRRFAESLCFKYTDFDDFDELSWSMKKSLWWAFITFHWFKRFLAKHQEVRKVLLRKMLFCRTLEFFLRRTGLTLKHSLETLTLWSICGTLLGLHYHRRIRFKTFQTFRIVTCELNLFSFFSWSAGWWSVCRSCERFTLRGGGKQHTLEIAALCCDSRSKFDLMFGFQTHTPFESPVCLLDTLNSHSE